MLYPPKILKFECLPVRPSVSASFPDSNLSSFWPIFFKVCMDIDIGEEWFGIASGLNSFINNRVIALDWCKMCFSSISSEQMDEVYALINTRSMLFLKHVIFGQFLTEFWPLIDVRILFMLNILWINLWISIKFCICIDIDKM